MKKQTNFLSLITLLIYFPFTVFSQTVMTSPQDFGKIKVWDMSSANIPLGKVYTIESKCQIVFNPSQSELENATMVVTGTYTSDSMKVAGSAYKNCEQIGNEKDEYFKPNKYLVFDSTKLFSSMYFSNTKECNAIQVYQLINWGIILKKIVEARTKTPMQWRFLVEKVWSRGSDDGSSTRGIDWMIVDFDIALTLSQACDYVLRLQRDEENPLSTYSSKVSACLLDAGVFRPFLLNGISMNGTFPKEQSNVIVIR